MRRQRARDLLWTTCGPCDKRLYVSRREARRVTSRKSGHSAPSNLSEYRCPVLDGWHIGKTPPGGREEGRRIRAYKAAKPT